MKKLLVVLLALCLTINLVACSSKSENEGKTENEGKVENESKEENESVSKAPEVSSDTEKVKPLKIAAVIPMTGTNKETGDMQKIALEYALEEINNNGGILGQPVEIEYVEAGSDQQSAITGIQKAVNIEGVSGIIGSCFSQYVIASSDIIKEAKIPCIALGSSVNIVNQKNPYMWMCRADDSKSLAALAKVAYETLGMRKPSCIYMTNAAGQGQHDSFVNTFTELGGTITLDLGFDNTTTSDFSPLVTQVANSDSDGLFCVTTGFTDGVLLTTTVAQYDLPYDKIGTPSVLSIQQDQVGDAMEGYMGIAEFVTDNGEAATEEYCANIMNKNPGFTPTLYDASTYDAFKLFCEAAKLSEGTDPESINEGLKLVKDMPAVLSPYSYHEDHTFANQVYNVTIADQNIVTMDIVKIYE